MSELTKEYLDKKLDKLATKQELKNLATKLDIVRLETKIEDKVAKLESKIETEIANLARMTSDGFEEIKKELDVKDRVDKLDRRMFKIEQALNIKN